MDFKHISVMPKEVIDALNLGRGGIYVDGTLGGGGHSGLIAQALCSSSVPSQIIGIDRDETALAAASTHINSCLSMQNMQMLPAFTAVRGNFHDMPEILENLGIAAVDGILLDLGVSSHQLDTPERGFSYRFDGPLDMRMDNRTSLTASDIVNTYHEKDLANLIFTYGEERHSRRIARIICAQRIIKPIETTLELASIIERVVPKKFGAPHPAMRTFMAIRIAVNDELSPLGSVLESFIPLLRPGGRIAVLTFHSLEDRIVKTTFQRAALPCTCPREFPVCICNKVPGLRVITKKPLLPSQAELAENNRAHSAKLRVAERI